MEEWQPYSRERKIKRCDGYVIIIPEKDKEDTIPVFCSVCEIRLLTRDDEEAYKKICLLFRMCRYVGLFSSR